jgi:hypothetical protein
VNRSWRSAFVVAVVLTSGCARQDAPGVDALVVQTDLAFGIAAATEPATAPPNVLAPLQPIEGAEQEAFTPPSLPPSEPAPECRTAGLTDFPSEPAARNVPDGRRPAEGDFRWVRAGEVRDQRYANVPISVDGFEQRSVRSVAERPPDTDATTGEERASFEFETVQADLTTRAVVVRTWRVRTGATSAGPGDLPVQPTIPGAPAPTTRGGDPDRGLSLVRQVTTTADGTESVFAPSSPLLVAPLPIRPGETFSSTAVDPSTFQSMSFTNATVGVPERVDACGDVVEGWPVDGTFQFVGPSGESVTFTYHAVVVPQLGAVLAAETIDQGVEGGPGMRVAWRLGELPEVGQ